MKTSTSRYVRNLLERHDVKIKKKFGQNYLIDDHILQKVADVSDIDDHTLVVEVGPGLGNLTRYLLEKSAHVLAYEIDDSLVDILHQAFPNTENLTLIHDDVLKRSLDEDIQTLSIDFDKVIVVANLPYYISTPFIMKGLETSSLIDRYVLMLQLEVARRLTASKDTKDYNALSVLIHQMTYAQFCFTLSEHVFIPKPKVKSAVITLDVKRENVSRETSLRTDFVKSAFKQRRKTLINNLHQAYGVEKEVLAQFLDSFGFDRNIRAENISPEEYQELADEFFQNIYVSRET